MGKKKLECDLVFEGGVTSAVAYGALLSRLSTSLLPRSLGGTSAGAVAAAAGAVAAARELNEGTDQGYRVLDGFLNAMAVEVDGRSGLLRLFQPTARLRGAFEVLLTALKPRWWALRLLFVALALLRWFPGGALVVAGSGAGLILAAAVTAGSGGPSAWWAWSSPILLVLALLGAVAQLAWRLLRVLPRVNHGLCSGRGASVDEPGLTDALHALYDQQFGRGAASGPVTFGDLWHAKRPPAKEDDNMGPRRTIDLQVITTAVELGQPFRLPGDRGTEPLQGFHYDPVEWRCLFPPAVMQALADGAPPGRRLHTAEGRELLPLPPMEKLPIVVAVRMSLSFPLLLASVPLYTLWRGHGVERTTDRQGVVYRPQRVHFTDGGITSNCPIDMFDVPLPGRPTFTVNLVNAPDEQTEVSASFSGERACPESRPQQIDPRRPLAVVQWLSRVLMTGLDWRDSFQRTLPGQRERVVNLTFPRGVGGLNLWMNRKAIHELRRGGELGAELMIRYHERVEGETFSRWEHHRWQRLRVLLDSLQTHLQGIHAGTHVEPAGPEPDYLQLLASRPTPEPRLRDDAARAAAQELLRAAAALGASRPPTPAQVDAPEPRAVLRPRPPL